MAVAVGLEIINLPKAFGIVLGVGGSAVMLNLGGKGQRAQNMGLGLVVLGLGLLCGAAAVLQQKPLYKKFGPATMTAYSFLASSGFFGLTCAVLYHEPSDWSWAWASQTNTLIVLYAVCVCSFINYATMCFANRHLDATVITMYAPVQTVVTGTRPSPFARCEPRTQLGFCAVTIQWFRHGGSPAEMVRDFGGLVLTAVGLWLVARQPKAASSPSGAHERAHEPPATQRARAGGRTRARGSLTPLLSE